MLTCCIMVALYEIRDYTFEVDRPPLIKFLATPMNPKAIHRIGSQHLWRCDLTWDSRCEMPFADAPDQKQWRSLRLTDWMAFLQIRREMRRDEIQILLFAQRSMFLFFFYSFWLPGGGRRDLTLWHRKTVAI